MTRIVVILLLSGSLLAGGCSRPTTETTAMATPTPQKVKAQVLEASPLQVEPMQDQPIMAVSPSPSATAPPP